MYYTPGVMFVRNDSAPGQMYTSSFDPAAVEKEVYKDIPVESKEETKIIGTEPQKVVTLNSGLEVPAYIIQRDIARKQAEIRKAEAAANAPLPRYYKIGMFAERQPAKAALVAVALGYLAGYLFI